MAAVIKVQKKDGTFQDWDKNKVLNSVAQVGLSPVETDAVSSLIESWVIKNATGDVIRSEDVKAKVIELLTVINPSASQAFAAYKKA